MMISIFLIVSFVLFCIIYIYRYRKYINEKKLLIQETQTEKELNIEKEKPIQEPIKYKLNTHKVRYWLYDRKVLHSKLSHLYEVVVYKNLWINEEFHSRFYELLILFNKNEFMIIDPNSRVLTLNIRNRKNEMVNSRSYQVFNSIDILKIVLDESIDSILKFQKYDAQNMVIAICIIILENSVHYLSNESTSKLINQLLQDYEFINDINFIINMVKTNNDRLKFIKEAVNRAYKIAYTEPYNDSVISNKPLQIPHKLPKKFLQEIY